MSLIADKRDVRTIVDIACRQGARAAKIGVTMIDHCARDAADA
jgi:hypothetical protein